MITNHLTKRQMTHNPHIQRMLQSTPEAQSAHLHPKREPKQRGHETQKRKTPCNEKGRELDSNPCPPVEEEGIPLPRLDSQATTCASGPFRPRHLFVSIGKDRLATLLWLAPDNHRRNPVSLHKPLSEVGSDTQHTF
jgi:hypothetical protein